MISSLFKYAPVQVFSALAVFALISVQTSYLSPSLYGLLAVVMVMLELIRTITTVWLNSTMLRLYPTADQNSKIQIQETVLALSIAGCIIGLLCLWSGLYLYGILTFDLFIIVSSLLMVKSLFQYQLEIARLKERTNQYRLALLSQALISVLAVWLMLMWMQTSNAALFGLFLSYAFSVWIFELPCLPKINKSKANEIIKYGVPLMLSGGIGLLSSRLDRLMIPTFVSLSAAGIYAAQANLLYGLIGLIFMMIALPLYPDLVKSIDSKEILQKKHTKYLTFLMAVSMPSLAGLILLNKEIVTIFLGDDYIYENSYLFCFLAFAIFINNIRLHFIDHGLQFLMKTKLLAPIALIGFLCNVILTPVMLLFFGIFGAAVSLLLINFALAIISVFIAIGNGYKYVVSIEVVRILVSTFLMMVFLFYAKNFSLFKTFGILNLVALIFIAAFFYFLMLFLFDFMRVRSIFFSRIKIFFG